MSIVKERAKARTKKENYKKEMAVRNQIVPMREDGTMAPKRALGTPIGNKQRMQEFKNKLLTEENGNKVLMKVLEVAMDDENPGQMAALKLCMDRMLPTSLFDESKAAGDRPSIQINITGIGEKVEVGSEPIDVEYEESGQG
jgi:hypothetical protein